MDNITMITKIKYMYRGYSNYKYFGEFFVAGTIIKNELEKFLFDGLSFNPLKIGLPHLLPDPLNDDDHMMHELLDFSPSTNKKFYCTAEELINKFENYQDLGWFQ